MDIHIIPKRLMLQENVRCIWADRTTRLLKTQASMMRMTTLHIARRLCVAFTMRPFRQSWRR
jgi:hypothetical protein